ncbi:MAG: hypothetical protein AAF799_27120 [Myxococcota bacterium]
MPASDDADETASATTEGASDGQYAVSVVLPGTPRQGYVVMVDSPADDIDVDLGQALEIPNGGIAVGPDDGEVVYLVDGATPRLTEFSIDSAGGITEGRTLSMEGFTASSSGARHGNFVFLSDTKAYVIDTLTQLVGIWDPSRFEITGTIDLGDTGAVGWIGVIGGRPLDRDGELVYSQSFVSFSSAYGPMSNVVFLDPQTDTVTRTVEIPDCAALTSLVLADNGDLWGASDVSSVFNRIGGLSDGTECIFRIPAGTYEVDRYVTFAERTGGRQGGTLMQQRDTEVYVRLLDEDLLPADVETLGDANGAAAWRWGRLDLAGDEPIEVFTDLPPMAGSTRVLQLDGTTWATEATALLATARMMDLSGDVPRGGLEVPGIIMNAFRIR